MKELLISASVALVLTTGFALAESQLGAEQTVYAPQSIMSETTLDVGSSFDGFSNFDESKPPSVKDQARTSLFGGR